MQNELVRFLQAPGLATYLALREKVITSETYDPYSGEFSTVSRFFEQEKIQEPRELLQASMQNLMLSPRAHQLLGFLHFKSGDQKSADIEMMIGQACLEGLLLSGDGSEERPFLVSRTSDEYDLLEHLEKEMKSQALMNKDDRYFDVMECTDGSKYWFDITDAYLTLKKRNSS